MNDLTLLDLNAQQLTSISVLKDININPTRKICRRHLACENALFPQ